MCVVSPSDVNCRWCSSTPAVQFITVGRAQETRQAGPEEEEQCRRSRHQVMRRRSSVEGVDTTQEAQGCQAGEAPEQYSMKKVLSGERAGAASLVML
ncbi:hypothetical protein NDA10_000632 [Ustilago hordei]|nr:hypothetical protein NDA10_000632 [Ustilago hordei]